MLLSMSTSRGSERPPAPRWPARCSPPWAHGLELPRGWRLSSHRVAGSVSVLLETADGGTAAAYVDLQTGERVVDLPGGRTASVLRETLRHVIALLEDTDPVEEQAEVRFDGADLNTWTPMQLLALRTGARWELSERIEGSTRQTQCVNDAIRSWLERT